ncbi:amidohydrolase [Brevibacillus choshinensis]|uniref:Amidohydrolase n=2 Tax=Brevibacillus choshinensis TaxID=54911 RepID=A0ABR5N3E3_BRECH|nr:amidohydrolase [Brevibacillus choshinensis]KQL45020.1 amidohydrolase [Brevibacillus choshinensis]
MFKKMTSALLVTALMSPMAAFAQSPGSTKSPGSTQSAGQASGKAVIAVVQPADQVFTNGVVYTVDRNRNVVQAVAIRGDQIVYVGSDEGAKKYIGKSTKVTDLQGKMLLPGFIDSHTHASKTTGLIYSIDLFDGGSLDEYVETIKAFIKEHPQEETFQGRGWSNPVAPGIGPRKEVLDAIDAKTPIALTSDDGHSLWVNSASLALAGITKDTKNPEGGIIERDPKTGEPSGTLREKAMDLVLKKIGGYTVQQYKSGIEEYQHKAVERGVTTVRDPDMLRYPNVLEAYEELAKENKLTIRFRNAVTANPDKGPEQVAEFVKIRERDQYPLFQVNAVKIFMDGVIEGATAYLEKPYEHKETNGELIWKVDNYNKTAAAVDKAGFQLHVHSIGDASTRIALDGMEYAEKQNGAHDARHSLVHLQLVNPQDIERFKKLGAVGIVQPFWFMQEDGYYDEIEVPYLGQERAEKEYPMKSFINQGVHIASSSDYIVTPEFNPLHGIQQGVTRIAEGETDPSKIANPDERATLADMIASFTIDGAYANHVEDITGSLEPGKKADLIVLDQNLFEMPATKIKDVKVLLTVVEGKAVYQIQPEKK